MEWVWKQGTGELFLRGSPVTTPFATGYAGLGEGRNNPNLQCVQDIGPIPRGGYTIGPARDTPAPLSLPLTPDASNDMCGRFGFLIHGDSRRFPGRASDGCIIIAERAKREEIRASGITRLVVIA